MVNFIKKLADGTYLFERKDTYFKLSREDMEQLIDKFELLINTEIGEALKTSKEIK